ncbi:MAG: phosphate/phosphite/phosphonate ABC transporter substrate-binding protein [Cyanophyceae cyanobacterium]|mgnify:CR=1 FL=1
MRLKKYQIKFKYTLPFGLIAALCIGCSSSQDQTSVSLANATAPESAPASSSLTAADPEKTITIGDIADDPVKKAKIYQPFADYLASQLNSIEIEAGGVKVTQTLEKMAEKMGAGEIDVYFDSPFPAMIVSDLSGAKPILRRWKRGVGSYHSIIFVRADGDVKTLDDLKGNLVSFEGKISTSGYMLPLAYLKEADQNPSNSQFGKIGVRVG